jgi:hypothetical protein
MTNDDGAAKPVHLAAKAPSIVAVQREDGRRFLPKNQNAPRIFDFSSSVRT